MPILYGLLSHQIFDKVCTCCLSLCSISSMRNILFVTLDIVLLIFHFQFLLLSHPSKARGTLLLLLLLLLFVVVVVVVAAAAVVVVTSMQCTYNYIPETNHVSMLYSVAAVLYLQTMLHVLLFPMLTH